MEALRTLFQKDLVARSAFASPPGGVWDRLGTHWTVVDVDHVLTRLDGLYGNAAPLADLLASGGPGAIVRGKDYHLLDLPAVQKRLQLPPDQQTRHPESGTSRGLYDCPNIALAPTGPVVRMLKSLGLMW